MSQPVFALAVGRGAASWHDYSRPELLHGGAGTPGSGEGRPAPRQLLGLLQAKTRTRRQPSVGPRRAISPESRRDWNGLPLSRRPLTGRQRLYATSGDRAADLHVHDQVLRVAGGRLWGCRHAPETPPRVAQHRWRLATAPLAARARRRCHGDPCGGVPMRASAKLTQVPAPCSARPPSVGPSDGAVELLPQLEVNRSRPSVIIGREVRMVRDAETAPEVRRWIERQLSTAPPLTDDVLRRVRHLIAATRPQPASGRTARRASPPASRRRPLEPTG